MNDASEVLDHWIMRVDISPQAADALLDTRAVNEEALKAEVLNQIVFEYTPYIPNKNAVYHHHLMHEDGVIIAAIFKVRAFNKTLQKAGWFVGIITPEQFETLQDADIENRDALMLDMLAVADDAARQRWVAHY